MMRWLVFSLGIAIAAGAIYLVVRNDGQEMPLDEIDDASKQRLERVLREAERRDAAR
jgi:hypothetical protein